MKISEHNFTICMENLNSPIILTVPHGGMPLRYASWLSVLFKPRVEPAETEDSISAGETVVLNGDPGSLHVAADILKWYPANAVIGLLPRRYVDYNRFLSDVAYRDPLVRPAYLAYHVAISGLIKSLKERFDHVVLLDIHGFGVQPEDDSRFDIVLGTDGGKSSPKRIDLELSEFLGGKYAISLSKPNKDGKYRYKGNTTNLYYHRKFGIDGVLVEIAPEFRLGRFPDSLARGQALARDLGEFLFALENRLGN